MFCLGSANAVWVELQYLQVKVLRKLPDFPGMNDS